ncbi:MAG: SDR family NAD(P)-dependent oxidoreductase [Gammaproteobacteria bacterium]|nr:SDR family NAD(P)-dependent oxidoreductase [Gammaproteobacteria bacterium]
MSMNNAIRDWRAQRVWLLGASTGIGAALATALLTRGARVAVSARRAQLLEQVIAPFDARQCCALPLDVRDADSVARAEQALSASWGGYDLVVVLAGDYQSHILAEFNLASARHILDTNLGGVYNVLAAVVPRLRAARAGGLVLVSSVAGYRGLPRSLVYGPSKAALNNLAEALYLELKDDNVAVSLVNPGFVRTPLTAHNPFPMPAIIEAPAAAEAIIAGLERGAFEIHFPRRFTWVMKALALLPAALYLPLMRWLTR